MSSTLRTRPSTSRCRRVRSGSSSDERRPDLAELGRGAGGRDQAHALTLDDQRAREHERGAVAARARPSRAAGARTAALRTGTDSPGQQRLVDREVDAVAAARRRRARGRPRRAGRGRRARRRDRRCACCTPSRIDERARARQVAQRLERALRLALLVEGDAP